PLALLRGPVHRGCGRGAGHLACDGLSAVDLRAGLSALRDRRRRADLVSRPSVRRMTAPRRITDAGPSSEEVRLAAVEGTVKSLFSAALEKEPAERTSFFDTACQGNDNLRRRVDALLHAAETADPLLDRPAAWHLQGTGPNPSEDHTPLLIGPFIRPL